MDEEIISLRERLKGESSSSKKAEILIEIALRLRRSDPKEAKVLADQAIALAKRGKEKEILGRALNFRAYLFYEEGDINSAISYLEKAIKIAEMIDNKSIKDTSCRILGNIYRIKGELDSARNFFEESLRLSKEMKDEDGVAVAYNNLSNVYLLKGELRKALEYQKMSLALKEAKGQISAIAVSRLNMGVIYEDMGDWEEAIECFYRAMVEKEKLKDLAGIALCYNNIGEIYLKKGKLEKAIPLFERAISYAEKADSLPRKAEAMANLGEANLLAGNPMRAMNLYVDVMEMCSKIGQKDELAKTYRRMGELLLSLGEEKEAVDFLAKALSLIVEVGVKKEEGNVRRALGKLFTILGKKEEAKDSFRLSCEILKELGIQYELGKSYFEFGKFLTENYAKEIGLPYLRDAERIFTRLEITKEKEALARYLYRLEEDKDRGMTLLQSLYPLIINPLPLSEFCSRCLSLLKEILLLEGAAIKVENKIFTVGKIDEEEGIPLPLFSSGKEIGLILMKWKRSEAIALSETIKNAIASAIVLGIERAKGLIIPPPSELPVGEIPFDGVIGNNPKILEVFETIKRVAPTKACVLIRGESGTGKELIARTIHNLSPRAEKPWVAINCAAIPETLLESELFGVEKGTATGVSERVGKFEMAQGGTVFLDEIGDMSPALQAKVLRVLQEKRFERVGGRKTIDADIRIIAATNRDLEKDVRAGRFREDLYYRLNVISLYIPPLRERREDIPLFVHYFITKYNKEFERSVKGVTKEVMDKFRAYEWPGNIRELENVIERAIILTPAETIGVSDLPPELQELPGEVLKPELKAYKERIKREVGETERDFIARILEEQDWNITKAADAAGISRRHFYRLLAKYKLKKP